MSEWRRHDDGLKVCRGPCADLLPCEAFPQRPDGRGPDSYCRPCRALLNRDYHRKYARQRGGRVHVEAPAGFKHCRGACGQTRPVTDFSRAPSHRGSDGYWPRCFDCVNRQKREYVIRRDHHGSSG